MAAVSGRVAMATQSANPQPAAASAASPLEKSAVTESSLPSVPSLSSSPRQFATELGSPSAIEEECDETESDEPEVNEPLTPNSDCRASGDFSRAHHPHHQKHHRLEHEHDLHSCDSSGCASFPCDSALTVAGPPTPTKRAPLHHPQTPTTSTTSTTTTTAAPARPTPSLAPTPGRPQRPTTSNSTSLSTSPPELTTPAPASTAEQDFVPPSLARRSTRGSTSSTFKRTVSRIFRSNSSNMQGQFPEPSPSDMHTSQREPPNRRWSMNRSSATTRSNSPPSPGSPVEMDDGKTVHQASQPTIPNSNQFFDKKKTRATTGLHLRSRAVNFISGHAHVTAHNHGHDKKTKTSEPRRRASSADFSGEPDPNKSQVWGMPAESGTGVKVRRMSLSLPDDFTVDIADLLAEYEYTHKILGRHGKHLGKGATSKVTQMVRKGTTNELYAVKEFRSRSSGETKEEYEKKIKSEYTLAKSLHHPNVIETIRLCTDHGKRWNHVMEYCAEGDLFALVKKGYLTSEDREKDRLCLFKQLVQGVHYLHSNGIAHRDIKLENLLITSESKLKITDFGVSEVFSGTHPGLREAGGQCGQGMGDVRLCSPGICGSWPYISPEVVSKNGAYDPRGLDVWGSAIVMTYLIFGGALWTEAKVGNVKYDSFAASWAAWDEKHPDEANRTITETDYPKWPAFDFAVRPPALRRLLLQMLHPDPARRYTIEQVINNRWFKKIECCAPESFDEPVQTIDASKKDCLSRGNQKKIFCHNHLPPSEKFSSHSLGKMPGSAGY